MIGLVEQYGKLGVLLLEGLLLAISYGPLANHFILPVLEEKNRTVRNQMTNVCDFKLV